MYANKGLCLCLSAMSGARVHHLRLLLLFILVVELGSSEIMNENGCTVTFYMNTAESVAPNGTKVTLHGRDLWAEFHKHTTEMIITNAGR